MHVVQVGHLSRAQLLKIVDGIYRGLVQKLGCNTMGEMPLDMVGAALMRRLREAKVRLECAIASAVVDGRKAIQMSDWPAFSSAAQHVSSRQIGSIV